MNEKEERGRNIAALSNLTQKDDTWTVPSQSRKGHYYTVNIGLDKTTCSCPDYENHRDKCKHIYAVEFTIERNSGTVTPEQIAEIPLRAKKVYTQDWPAYRLAQINEKAKFQELLAELCSGVDEPIQGLGRARLPMADMIFAAVFKVYSTVSTRRFISDLKEAYARRYISKFPCYNSIIGYLEMERLTPYLQWLIVQSSLPLHAVETKFAVDASGFSTCTYVRWVDEKYGKEQVERDWVKAHIICGVQTNVVTSVEISDKHDHDSNYFASLVNETGRRFNIEEVSADKAYSSYAAMRLVDMKGAVPYIDFKAGSTDTGKCKIWNTMYHFYSLRKEEFMEHYHQRSNVEATFSMVKAKFGSSIRSKLPVAQTNEVLCKFLAHNLCCLIQSSYELGIQATFWDADAQIA